MPGPQKLPKSPNSSDEIYMYESTPGLSELADAWSVEEVVLRTERILSELGAHLVEEVRQVTPSVSGRLRSSTYMELSPALIDQDSIIQSLYIGQSALSTPIQGYPYPYWRAVTAGLQPRGKLTQAKPPFVNLIPWVQTVFGLSGKEATTRAVQVSKDIAEFGSWDDPYFDGVVFANKAVLQSTADRLGATLAAVVMGVEAYQ